MAVKKKGLGRGLDALFPEKSVKPAEKKTVQKPVASESNSSLQAFRISLAQWKLSVLHCLLV